MVGGEAGEDVLQPGLGVGILNIELFREDINRKKKRFLSGIARMRGGVYPCPDFLAPFFAK